MIARTIGPSTRPDVPSPQRHGEDRIPEGSRRQVDSRRSLVVNQLKIADPPWSEDCGRRFGVMRAGRPDPSATNRRDTASTARRRAARSPASNRAGRHRGGPRLVLVASSDRPSGSSISTSVVVSPRACTRSTVASPVGRGARSSSRRHARRLGPAGARCRRPARTRRRRRRAVPPRARASTRPRRAPSRAGRPRLPRHSATTTRGATPARCSTAAATRSSRSRARWTRIGTSDCAASRAPRRPARAAPPAVPPRAPRRHPPRRRAPRHPTTVSRRRRRRSPRPRRSTRSALSGRPATATTYSGELGDDADARAHDGAPAWIAAAAASARSIAKIASSSTSWYSMVAVPSRSAASARHSRT